MTGVLFRFILRRPGLVLGLLFAVSAALSAGAVRLRLPLPAAADGGTAPLLVRINGGAAGDPAPETDEGRRLLRRDLKIYVPLAGGLAFLLLLASFLCWEGVLPPLASAVLPLVWILTLLPLPPGHADLWNPLLLHLLLSGIFGPAVHLLYRYRENLAMIHDRPEALGIACRRVLPTAALPWAVTVASFGILAATDPEAPRAFGVLGAAGTAAMAVSAGVFLPALLVLSPRLPPRNPLSVFERTARRWIPAWSNACRDRRPAILAMFAGITAGAAYAVSALGPGAGLGALLAAGPALAPAAHLLEALRAEGTAERAIESAGRPAAAAGLFLAGGFAVLPASDYSGMAAAGLGGGMTALWGLVLGLAVIPAVASKRPGKRR